MKNLALIPVTLLIALLMPLSLQAETVVAERIQQGATSQPAVPEAAISINSASAQELVQGLNGIGLKKAEAIVDYRERYGAFTSLEQLQEVPGIGSALVARNLSRMKL